MNKTQANELNELYETTPIVNKSLSYSRLSDFDRNGPKALIERSVVDGFGAKIGSIVDDLTIPKDGDVFEDKYLISDCAKPTASSLVFANIILDNYSEIPDQETLIQICKDNSLWVKYKEDKLLSTIYEENLQTYLKDHIQSSHKTIITSDDYYKSTTLSDILKTHPHSKWIFSEKYERINQYALKFTYNDVIFRGYIDIILIDHANKTVKLIDLKTGAKDHADFKYGFIGYRYYLQSAIYSEGFESICKDLGLEGYTLEPFKFLYIGRSEKIPVVFNVTPKIQKAALEGFKIGKYRYRGLDELIEEVKWHFKHNEFTFPRSIIENKGVIDLDDETIILEEDE